MALGIWTAIVGRRAAPHPGRSLPGDAMVHPPRHLEGPSGGSRAAPHTRRSLPGDAMVHPPRHLEGPSGGSRAAPHPRRRWPGDAMVHPPRHLEGHRGHRAAPHPRRSLPGDAMVHAAGQNAQVLGERALAAAAERSRRRGGGCEPKSHGVCISSGRPTSPCHSLMMRSPDLLPLLGRPGALKGI